VFVIRFFFLGYKISGLSSDHDFWREVPCGISVMELERVFTVVLAWAKSWCTGLLCGGLVLIVGSCCV